MDNKRSWFLLWTIALLGMVVVMLLSCVPPTVQARGNPVRHTYANRTFLSSTEFLYYTVQEKAGLEGAFCVLGRVNGDSAIAVGLFVPAIDSAGKGSVFYRQSSCPETATIGTLHFHPDDATCEWSDTDWYTFYHDLPYQVGFLGCKENGKFVIKTYWKDTAPKEEPDTPSQRPVIPSTGMWTILYRYNPP